ncbi:MAG: HAMP domain-containing histidine kinase [Bacteroidetes bacterium]|nr:HAMP domain-containing histidine kinase [Bacteroidota bacterium]
MKRMFRYSFYVKTALVIVAILLSTGTVFYTSRLVEKLEVRQKQVAETWAAGLQHLASSDPNTADLTFIFDEIVSTIDFPVIVTDSENQPIPGFYRNIIFPEKLPDSSQISFLRQLVASYDRERDPILVTVQDTLILQKIHYGNSALIDQLRWFPYVQISLVAGFILFGYFAFSIIRRQEQSSVWVGMSKETAHQLGTPLSGLLAWIEILKSQNPDDEQLKTIGEMEQDLERLMMVTDRFSKIGAKPVLVASDAAAEIRDIAGYLDRRLFKTKSRVASLQVSADHPIYADLNPILFRWVIENLIKNALDACSEVDPVIQISLYEDKQIVFIDVSDNGKGMPKKLMKEIFRPGFTTKQRGWGMGLSLAKRIIHDYHGGKIGVVQSVEGKGTTFRIQLKKSVSDKEIHRSKKDQNQA